MTEDGQLTLFSVQGPGVIVTLAGVLADPSGQRQLFNSLIMAVGITAAKIAVSLRAGFAIVYFR